MKSSDRWRLEHIADALNSATDFIHGRQRADLDSDRMLVFALVRAMEIVGEAAAKVSPDARLEFPDLPWLLMIGMRNRLVHAYFDVDVDTLWDTVAQDVPALVKRLSEILLG
jgi:uncharacterized protein with HEPN domain